MWVFKAIRAFATLFSLYILYKGLQLGSMKVALLYLLPGMFWCVYYYYFVREILNGRRVPIEERVWYVLFLMTGITGIFAGAAFSSTGIQFLISVAVWIFILLVLGRTEERIKNVIKALGTYSGLILPAIFVTTGTLVYIVVPTPLNLTYLLTFIAIGGTIYEWELFLDLTVREEQK